ncbi:MAG: VWA domain-containing protein [Desulfovibrio sp.]|jgi:serine/threonine-protein kinase PpkA|nr:VWA domain-containing protein [Desulfovibrio sp.]
MLPRLALSAFLLLLACLPSHSMAAANSKPLLQDGKKTLYQRVISHPGAQLLATQAAGAKVLKDAVTPFTVFYVYGKGQGKLEVGTSSTGADGWIDEEKTTRWDQSLTLLFTPRTGRDPVLFFREEKDLAQLCAADDMEKRIDALIAGSGKGGGRLVAMEPDDAKGAVSSERFYIMPIMEMTSPFEGVKFLKVASIDPGTDAPKGKPAGPPRTAIALVIDTSISMKPYIDQSLNLIRSIYDSIEKSKMAENVGFAVVVFRSSVKATPGLGYVSKVICDFTTAKDRTVLEKQLAQVEQATASSHDFNEDSLAGVQQAVTSLSWGDYSSRLILLVTDAGPLQSGDVNKSIPMDVETMNDFARQKGIWISTIHIKSPAGKKNHQYAEESYRKLTRLSGGQSNYLAIDVPDHVKGATEFLKTAKSLASRLVQMVTATAEGKQATRPKEEAPKGQSPEKQAELMAERLGYAMQLDYLGRQQETRAPSVVDSWITDMDLKLLAKQKHVPNVDVAVLLTKNQLSDLSSSLNIIVDEAERTKKTDSRDFFQGILSASTRMARDPNAPTQKKTLAELGVLAEFLEGLPYKSEVMLLNEDDWYRKSVGEQTAFVNRLKARLARYQEYDRDRGAWETFGQSNSGDWVYRVPLDMLP